MKTLSAKELALYLGCECVVDNEMGAVQSIDIVIQQACVMVKKRMYYVEVEKVKPILRPLSDMTEPEQFELAELIGVVNVEYFIKAVMYKRVYNLRVLDSFEVTVYLLSKHFDLFGWIEQNLAVDKSTLK